MRSFDSCWIDSDDGAIAAFIVPIVAIMLVDSSIANLCQCIAIGSLQVNCVFLAITLKVLITKKKSMSEKAASNKDMVK